VELAVQSQLLLPVGRTYAATWLVVRGRKRSIKKKKKKKSKGGYTRDNRKIVGVGVVELEGQSHPLCPGGRNYDAKRESGRGRKRGKKKKKKKQSIGEYCRRKRNTVGGGRIAEIRINYDCRSLLGLYKILILI